jgi:hypothetical protein
MSYGMITQSPGTTYPLTLHTDVVDSLFYKNAGTYTNTGSISSSGFLASFGVATPINPVTWGLYSIYNQITVTGTVSSDGSQYKQPTYQTLAYNGLNPANEPTPVIVPAPAYVHSFGSLSGSSGYGFSVKGPTSLAVSPSNRAYCVHPTSTGGRIRSSTASSLTFPFASGAYGTISTFTQPTGPNVIFDQAYDTPPLIFVTESSGPITMNFMNRNSSGKYVSASISSYAPLTTRNSYDGLAAYGSSTATFSYFIVSDEEPVHGPTADYGVRVFDSTGTKMYDSTNVMPNFVSLSVATPYMALGNDGYYNQHDGIGFSKSASLGVCINPLTAFTGYSEYLSVSFAGMGLGPISFFGRYLTCTSTTATVTGNSTGALFRGYVNYRSSYDFTRSVAPNINILFGSYYL